MNANELQNGQPALILVIDDDPEIVDLLSAFLEIAHVKSLSATSPEMALNLWKQHRDQISIVVTDLHMPGTNGDVLAAAFLKDKPSLKVIFTSGTPWITGVKLVQGHNFFHKPFSFNQITSRIIEIIKSLAPVAKKQPVRADAQFDTIFSKASAMELPESAVPNGVDAWIARDAG
jgi:DNA-binding NtrC family response regulator